MHVEKLEIPLVETMFIVKDSSILKIPQFFLE